jgi:hypothetical protein
MRPTPIFAISVLIWTVGMLGAASPNQSALMPARTESVASGIVGAEQSSVPKDRGKKTPQTDKKPAKQQAQAQTFTGIVEWEYKPLSWDCAVPNCDHFALYDDATKANYEIDDARAALPFEGKRAKVTGVLDAKTSTIHLRSIEGVQ